MKRQKKKFSSPLRPWDRGRIEVEREVINEYGLRRKKEIWRAQEILRELRRRGRESVAKKDKSQEKVLIERAVRLGLVGSGAKIDDVLALTLKNILDRRLQTLVFKKGLANTPKQARQFIVHGHVSVSGSKLKWPSYIVPTADETNISFYKKELKTAAKEKEPVKAEIAAKGGANGA
ncbi:MAG: 30S ribosomal protein S4 [Candidatus Aenigmarchaeota archaeon]|nr:30S ribosomal protein S4 [Candidatus Aenigmarchaeota archaeon]